MAAPDFPRLDCEHAMTIEIGATDRVLATGATGCIGSALAAAERALGCRQRPYREGSRDAVCWLAQHGQPR
jgi:hypothetical protein